MDYETLTGPEKAAIVILSLPQDAVNVFLGQLGDDEVRKALAAVARMDEIPPRVQERVLEEFHNAAEQGDHTISGGRSRALEIIELTAAQRPEKRGEPQQAEEQCDRDKPGQRRHVRAPVWNPDSRIAFAVTRIDDVDMASAATRGVT